ncbi:MAG TPA: trypsin-like peptidase domain-containing protein [Acidimicrobiales bacterium]|nr:trypsin-like peptidase domain-containing protein [Acidimicrobiales bacterium]
MDWDDDSSAVPVNDEPTSPAPAVPTVTVRKSHWRLAKSLSALVLVVVIGGAGFVLGHDIVTPTPLRSAAPKFNFPSFPSGGFGNGNSPSIQIPATPQNTKADAAAAKIARKVDPGLVDISTTFAGQNGTAEGTGMILSANGLVLTNNHVVEDAATISVRDVATNTTYVGTVVGYDLSEDVALVQLKDASGLTTIKTANSDKVFSGQKIVGVGNAGGVGGTPSFVAGSVVALNQAISAGDETNPAGSESLSGLIEVNAPIQPGDSGGPLVNQKGQVVGMDTAGSSLNGGFGFNPGGTSSDQGYAIPINTALAIVSSIKSGNVVSGVHIGPTAFLGVEFDSAAASFGGANVTSGVTIAGTIAGTPAQSAGLAAGDVITSIDGQSITTGSELQTVLLTKKPGDTIHVNYVNANGAANTVSVKLVAGPAQ